LHDPGRFCPSQSLASYSVSNSSGQFASYICAQPVRCLTRLNGTSLVLETSHLGRQIPMRRASELRFDLHACRRTLFLFVLAAGVVIVPEVVGLSPHEVHAEVAPTDASPAPSKPTASAPNRAVSPWQTIAVGTVLAAGAIVWVLLYRRGRKRNATPVTAEIELPDGWNPAALFNKREQVLQIISDDMASLFESRLTIRHLMSTDVKTVLPTMFEEEVGEVMERGNVRHLLVCREDSTLLGIVSNRDIRPEGERQISRIMTPDPVTVTPDSLVNPAMTMMMKWRISCLPVVVEGRVVGIITTTDLMMALQAALKVMQKVSKQVSVDANHGAAAEAEFSGSGAG
jgi:CBS domain-containing protein